MNNRIAGVWRLQLKGMKSMLLTPWMIVVGTLVLNLLLFTVASSSGNDTKTYNSAFVVHFIYMFVYSIIIVNQTFPFAIGMNVRRLDYTAGTLLHLLSGALIASMGLTLFSFLETDVTGNWGGHHYFFTLPYIHDGNYFQQFVVMLMLMLAFIGGGFLLGSLYRRAGASGVIVFLSVLVTAFIGLFYFKAVRDAVGSWLQRLPDYTAFGLSLWLLPLSLLMFAASAWLLRRAEG